MNELVVTPDTDLSQMSDDEIQNYLKDASHWQITRRKAILISNMILSM